MATFYKSRFLADPIIYVQEGHRWLTYSPTGVRESQGSIPDGILAGVEEIAPEEAEKLISLRLSDASTWDVRRAEDLSQGPSGLGGWLVLPIIGLFGAILWNAAYLFGTIAPSLDTWSVLTTPGNEFYHSLWAPTLVFETFVTVVLMAAPIGLLVLLFQKRRILPALMVAFYGFLSLTSVIDAILMISFVAPWSTSIGDPEYAAAATSDAGQLIFRAIVLAAVWIPYFLVSKRVKNTFVGPPSKARVLVPPGLTNQS